MNAKFGITGASFFLMGNHEKSVHICSSVHPRQETTPKPSILQPTGGPCVECGEPAVVGSYYCGAHGGMPRKEGRAA